MSCLLLHACDPDLFLASKTTPTTWPCSHGALSLRPRSRQLWDQPRLELLGRRARSNPLPNIQNSTDNWVVSCVLLDACDPDLFLASKTPPTTWPCPARWHWCVMLATPISTAYGINPVMLAQLLFLASKILLCLMHQ